MRVSAKGDYAVRAAVELAALADQWPVKAEVLAGNQAIPIRFLENILAELRHAGLVDSRRGADGGHLLARPAAEITIADVIRAVEGPLAGVAGTRPESLDYPGAAAPLKEVWIALRANLREILEQVSLADVAAGKLPSEVAQATERPGAWTTR